ncbi:MAG: glycine cleavage system aminomethyltransferase GcvT [Flavobacteriaceae bacterium]|nr:glycine cleavage system aminomethyltransferase GcvT [Flavobacteriaceae bacterium]MDG1032451.1 glycine cleavage system aminomethyltransferase GcvT [Flavobacteriaceae bacterium]MDG1344429.1 glycine cleavage system aminomethyltransferase GcvT [Flavobacteriaceae bacterium]MDG1791888.1 glycine cleavage system aminomethyltransferase GcvT [Flavobacteriaceae bacterium]MDG2485824.1 glycine cleavage system aminomethyltransferase GcvT [Flavobacteriaceae bacterium]
MKKTSLFDIHVKSNAKMVPFAGFNMPVQFEGVNIEHLKVRNSVGIFDVSHMGEFLIDGDNATEFLNYICSNDILLMSNGKAQYNCLINHSGGIIDDSIVYKFGSNSYMIVVNASNIDKDWDWILEQNIKFNNKLTNISDSTSLLALQGPKANEVLQKLIDFDLSELTSYSFIKNDIKEIKGVIISTTGYTGSGGVELYVNNKDAVKLYNLLIKTGEYLGIKPIGLAARDTLRLEMGYCLYGNDINDTTNPIEAGLKWATKTNKDFIGIKHILNTIENGTEKKLIGFVLNERGIPRKGYKIFDSDQNEIGLVTSGTMSPILKKGIGMGYVKSYESKLGNKIFIQIRNKYVKSEIVKPPFIK